MNHAHFIGCVGLWAATFTPAGVAAEQSLALPPDVVNIVTGGRVEHGNHERHIPRYRSDWRLRAHSFAGSSRLDR